MAGPTGSAPVFGPCSAYAEWSDVASCGGCPDVEDPEDQALWLALATEVVWGILEGKFSGQCVRIFSPCRPACVAHDRCTCGGVAKARLDLGPVPVWGAFVTVDGVEVEVSIEDWRYLIREDGEAWPSCLVEDWTVEYTYGWPVPTAIRLATARLACEYAKQCAGEECGLPPATSSYTREGITVQITDPESIITAGRTGIDFVDRILSNPMFRTGGQLVDLANSGLGPSTSWP